MKQKDETMEAYTIRLIREDERERCIQAVKTCAALDENGYICTKDDAIKAILGQISFGELQ
jgi:hypothetical protein